MEIQLWREILEPYGQAVDELVVKFNHIKQEYQNARMYSPIESVSGRVKSISSIMEKTQRKNVRIEELEDKIEDIAGIRIICQFVEDINTHSGHKYRCKNYKKTWGFGSKAGERLYNKQQAERLQKLSYNSLLHSADDIWSQKT